MKTAQERAARIRTALLGHRGPHHTAVVRSKIYEACEATDLNPRNICDAFSPSGSTLTDSDISNLEFIACILEQPDPRQESIDVYMVVENSYR